MLLARVPGPPVGALVGEVRDQRSRALILPVVLIVLAALAHARPPDPTWITGVYDDADSDDVVIVAEGSAMGVVDDPRLPLRKRTVLPVAIVPVVDAAVVPAVSSLRVPIRAPPLRKGD